MGSVPGTELLPPNERQLFTEQFEKDLEFFQIFFLLINRSCPIKNIDLVWEEHGPSGRASFRHLGITEALAGPCSRLLSVRRRNPHPAFCNLVNGYGQHEPETCEISDKAAADVVHRTGCAHVYQCHFGLTDIAVPIMIRGQHVATLFTGQVHREPPSDERFRIIARTVKKHAFIDVNKLERAYFKVPVVTPDDIRNTTEILEAFAQYVASSWERLSQAVKEGRRRDRELQILRKEFAYVVLGGTDGKRSEVRDLIRTLGFSHPPNRALVVKLQPKEEGTLPMGAVDVNLTAAVQAIEDLGEKSENVSAAYLRNCGVSVFFYDPRKGGEDASEFYAHRLANRVLYAVEERCDIQARIGIGGRKRDWSGLSQSHQEACAALLASDKTVAKYQPGRTSFKDLSRRTETIIRLMRENNLAEANSVAASLSAALSRTGADGQTVVEARLFFSSALESMCFTACALGCNREVVASLANDAAAALARAGNLFEVGEAWFGGAGEVLGELRRLYAGKRKKIIERACRMIEQQIEHPPSAQTVSIPGIAAALGISPSHLSRTFKRATGQTLEHYMMQKRVEISKRLLLDPVNNISDVAQRCGFSDASYFARVFRMLTGCSPRQFCDDPMRYSGGASPEQP